MDSPNEIFDFVEDGPIASASIGQVYKVRIRSAAVSDSYVILTIHLLPEGPTTLDW